VLEERRAVVEAFPVLHAPPAGHPRTIRHACRTPRLKIRPFQRTQAQRPVPDIGDGTRRDRDGSADGLPRQADKCVGLSNRRFCTHEWFLPRLGRIPVITVIDRMTDATW
jgi:hypothetical protein